MSSFMYLWNQFESIALRARGQYCCKSTNCLDLHGIAKDLNSGHLFTSQRERETAKSFVGKCMNVSNGRFVLGHRTEGSKIGRRSRELIESACVVGWMSGPWNQDRYAINVFKINRRESPTAGCISRCHAYDGRV